MSASTYVSSAGAQLLFDPALVPSSMTSSLPEHVVARPLARDDHNHNHIQLLSTLTKAPELSPETYEAQFDHLLSCPSTYFIVVLASSTTGAILGSASLVVEHKFLRNAGKVGHIEDVVVSPSLKGKNLGKTLVTGLTELAKTLGCYKVILDCDPKNVGFYEKCGYSNSGIEMAFYHNRS